MYTTSSWSIVHALDARTGEKLWTFDPEVPKEKSLHSCCDVVNRGVAIWEDQVFVGAFDGRLIALDAASGKVNWGVATFDPQLDLLYIGVGNGSPWNHAYSLTRRWRQSFPVLRRGAAA